MFIGQRGEDLFNYVRLLYETAIALSVIDPILFFIMINKLYFYDVLVSTVIVSVIVFAVKWSMLSWIYNMLLERRKLALIIQTVLFPLAIAITIDHLAHADSYENKLLNLVGYTYLTEGLNLLVIPSALVMSYIAFFKN